MEFGVLNVCTQAGEDLEEEEEDKEEDEEGTVAGPSSIISTGISDLPEESTPLLRGTKPRLRRRRGASVGPRGNATVMQAVLMVCVISSNSPRS